MNPADDCAKQLNELIEGLDAVKDKRFYTYDQETFLDTTQGLLYPCVGIVYEGITSSDRKGDVGKSSNISFGLILLMGEKSREVRGTESKEEITLLLDQIRKAIMGKQSPTGHKWRFSFETVHDFKEDSKGLGYYQRFMAAIIL